MQRPSTPPAGTLGRLGWPLRPVVAVDRDATLRTKKGRTFATSRATLRRAGAVTRTFAFNAAARAGHARTGSRLRLTVDAENASGISGEVVRDITLRDAG